MLIAKGDQRDLLKSWYRQCSGIGEFFTVRWTNVHSPPIRKKRKKVCLASGLSSDLGLGDELDEVRVKSGILLNLVCYIIHTSTTGRQGLDLLDGRVSNGEVLIQVFPVTPDISFQQFDTLHIEEQMNGIGYGFHVGNGNLNHL